MEILIQVVAREREESEIRAVLDWTGQDGPAVRVTVPKGVRSGVPIAVFTSKYEDTESYDQLIVVWEAL